MEQELDRQAEFVANLSYYILPYEVIQSAKRILLDSIGVIAFGNTQLTLEGLEPGTYPVIGTQMYTDKLTAAFINGTAMVKNELDEGNQFAFGHPACHIVPALLMEARHLHSSPCEMLMALAAAYEVSCRWGASARLQEGYHVHGTAQTIGAAVAVAALRHLDAVHIRTALILANSLPQSTSWCAAIHGDQLRNAYIGISNCIGMSAVDMAAMGVSSSIETLQDVWNRIAGREVDMAGLTAGLGTEYLITKNYYKQYSACRYIHAFADMAEKLRIKGIRYEDITSIEIETYKAAASLRSPKSENVFAAKFSIPVSLAVYFVYGHLDALNITEEMVADERVSALAEKIHIAENAAFTAELPLIRKNKMVIHLQNGTCQEMVSTVTDGDYTKPFSDKKLQNKFTSLTEGIWKKAQQRRLEEILLDFENQKNTEEFFELMGKDGGRYVKNRQFVR